MKIWSVRNLLMLILVFQYSFSDAQIAGHLLGIKYSNSPLVQSFVDVDPQSGQTIVISNLSPPYNGLSGHTLDSKNNRFFLITADSINMYLVNYDVASGYLTNILYTRDSVGNGIGTSIGSQISNPFYNCIDDQVYFFYFKKHQIDSTFLAKVDPSTLIVTTICAIPWSNIVRRQIMDFRNQKIYFFNFSEPATLYTYDLINNSFSSVILSYSWFNSVKVLLVFNSSDNNLYGTEVLSSTNPDSIGYINVLKVNPVDGNVTVLAQHLHTAVGGFLAFDETGKHLFFGGSKPDSYEPLLFDFNIENTTYISHESGWITGLDYYFPPEPDTTFFVTNYCQHSPTEFQVSNKQSLVLWNFGDSLSSSNISSGAYTTHTYNLPGNYIVKMISSNCYGIDTVEKLITIESFPEINIGRDTMLCINHPNEPILFNAIAPSSTFFWQDGSTSSSYSSTYPELITVAINSSCGVVHDTAEITGTNCSCDISLNPNLTTNSFSYSIECFISNYGDFHFELFDIVGKKIIDNKIISNDGVVDTKYISAGTYIYRFRTEKEIYKTGKIIVIH